jgi:hypothetical protein
MFDKKKEFTHSDFEKITQEYYKQVKDKDFISYDQFKVLVLAQFSLLTLLKILEVD